MQPRCLGQGWEGTCCLLGVVRDAGGTGVAGDDTCTSGQNLHDDTIAGISTARARSSASLGGRSERTPLRVA